MHRTPLFALRLSQALLLISLSVSLSSCVTSRTGKKHLDPWGAAMRADQNVGDVLEDAGFPTDREETRIGSGIELRD